MKPAKTSKTWMAAHVNDSFVQQARQAGYRSRAAYKLLEIDARDRLFVPGMTVVDLGSTPGSWSQVALSAVGQKGRVIALDILPMQPIPGVVFIQGDFRENKVLTELEQTLAEKKVDLVISDMSPNLTGIHVSDQARSAYLAELALEFCDAHLNPGKSFLVKVFQGSGFESFRQLMQASFDKVVTVKPKASRDRSKEVYLLGRGKVIC
ncbi:RlmE family RNA methyltransferase [Nitrosomonas mobilis]|uniref:Ribosomal RNA large subunit methyltransferase E n=1 Tax=Nitrosomonas mobilis TaxID=51642 RepID=A0A1G5SDR9_9PROT|nr:RlmE family RNA methyltransferase [Nitrosomonas mobilis]SCZ85282.1 23S rRNA methyltransferase [Nitrosomonas mobilis]HNO74763.1 RlmE family RNA methyltransferase [Nitrosomonas mobilis]